MAFVREEEGGSRKPPPSRLGREGGVYRKRDGRREEMKGRIRERKDFEHDTHRKGMKADKLDWRTAGNDRPAYSGSPAAEGRDRSRERAERACSQP